MNEQPKRSSTWRLIFSATILVIAALLFLNRQTVIDHVVVRSYTPDAEVTMLAKNAKLNDKGTFLFYASRPAVESREVFNDTCVESGEKSAVLGCYVGMRIYIFDIDDERLTGIKEVTSAHEMLHAAYDRLSSSEQTKVDALVEKQLSLINDERINSLVKLYEKTEPGERANELHSILGTELEVMLPELESYYAQFFLDRKAVVALARQYETVFDEISAQQNALVQELNTISAQISAESDAYNAATEQLNDDIDSFNKQANSGQFSNQSQFNAERQKLINQQAQLAQARAALNAKIALYNEKRTVLQSLNGKAEDLNRSLNSQLPPVPSV